MLGPDAADEEILNAVAAPRRGVGWAWQRAEGSSGVAGLLVARELRLVDGVVGLGVHRRAGARRDLGGDVLRLLRRVRVGGALVHLRLTMLLFRRLSYQHAQQSSREIWVWI